MRQELEAAFGAHLTACITETNEAKIEMFDCYDCTAALQRSYIKTADHHPLHFTLDNPTQENLTFAAIDNCLIHDNAVRKCDFSIGNFDRLFLVEIKEAKASTRRYARQAASEQLSTTLARFRAALPLQNTELIAVMCLMAKKAYPVFSARKVADVVAFKDQHNARLVEGQQATFRESQ